MDTIRIKDQTLAIRISSIARGLGITPDAVATGILYAHCMSAKEKKKDQATPATTATAQPEEAQPKPPVIDGIAAMRALRAELKQS